MALAKGVRAKEDEGESHGAREPKLVTIDALGDILAEARKSQRWERSLTANMREADGRTASGRAQPRRLKMGCSGLPS